jgi:hypothetical protein
VLDRYTEGLVLAGLAWHYRDTWMLLAVFAAALGSVLVSYVRARGEGLGARLKSGTMQRPERLILLGSALTFSPVLEALLDPTNPEPSHRLVAGAVIILAVGSNATALRRLGELLRVLDPEIWGTGAVRTLRQNLLPSSAATGLDFLVVLLLVHRAGLSPVTATVAGCLAGGVVHFALTRARATAGATPRPGRHGFVTGTSAALNAGGVAILLLLLGVDYRIAWWLVRGVVYVAWNYPLHRGYLFVSPAGRRPRQAGRS